MVPALLEQINDYVENGSRDKWKDLTFKDAEEMSDEEKGFLLKNFFMLNWDKLIKTSSRYSEILTKRESYVKKHNWDEMGRFFSNQELLDLQVLFNLKWFGFMAREDYPFLKELDEKDRFFTKAEKKELIRLQDEILAKIIPMYRELQDAGKMELTFTPYYHPIFPLVYDTDFSRRSAPGAPMPKRFSYPEDAEWQLTEGKKYAEEQWGKKLSGMWPAEGSVSPEIIPVASDAGVKWMATDEAILFRSINNFDKSKVLYKPYVASHKGKEVVTFFRDKYISDLIGFSFSKMDAKAAADIFLHYVESVAVNSSENMLPVILDGENAWESYNENGKEFLYELFSRISTSDFMSTETYENYVESLNLANLPSIDNLFSGSWINNDYMIWIGNDEDNTAWNYLKRVRDFVRLHFDGNPDIPESTKREAMRHIYRAEGSDWFWWYGDHFSTENDILFDRLFRRHLRQVYTILGVDTPNYLDIPITSVSNVSVVKHPTGLVSPVINGYDDSYYAWNGAGIFDNLNKPGSSMYNSVRIVDQFAFGCDMENFYLKVKYIEPASEYESKEYVVKCFLMNEMEMDFSIPLRKFERTDFNIMTNNIRGKLGEIGHSGYAAQNDVLEIAIDYRKVGVSPGENISVYFKIFSKEKLEIERIPEVGVIEVLAPDENYLIRMWDV